VNRAIGIGALATTALLALLLIARPRPEGDAARISVALADGLKLRYENGLVLAEVETRSPARIAARWVAGARRVNLTAPASAERRHAFALTPEQAYVPFELELVSLDSARLTTDRVKHPGLGVRHGALRPMLPDVARLDPLQGVNRLSVGKAREFLLERAREYRGLFEPLAELAPALLDHPTLPLEEKRAIHDALVPLRVLDRLLRSHGHRAVFHADLMGRTFAGGADRSARARGRTLGSTTKLIAMPEIGEATGAAVLDIVGYADTDDLEITSPPRAGTPVALQLHMERPEHRNLVWVHVFGWRLLVPEGASFHDDRDGRKPDKLFFHGLDPRMTHTGRHPVRVRTQTIPGDGPLSQFGKLDHARVIELPRE
jgi:hypothetical protein